MIVSTNDIGEQSINLTWSFLRQPGLIDEETTLTYVLKVVPSTSDASPLFLNVQDSFYEFSAPRDAPPCEVYNFSVTATYVGATYTGDGCSVPSPVISRMLPSLPDIRQLNSSLKFSLEKQISGGVMLTVSLRVSNFFVN